VNIQEIVVSVDLKHLIPRKIKPWICHC